VRLGSLERAQGELRLRESEMARVQGQLNRLAAVPQAADQLTEAMAKLQRLEKLEKQFADVADVQQRMNKGKELLVQTEAELKAHLAEYEGVLRRLGKCPTCMQPVAPGSIKQILAELAGGPSSGHAH
ncbi:MAG TPA: hypothetical protein VNT01_08680, partial [Symbiobacteriaceae bacterium]|nr:hypothetical protein [Symbiobacteriaceae bacterium]